MADELDVLRIVKEDVLEALGRKNGRTPLDSMELEVAAPQHVIAKAIRELEEEGLIKVSTEEGSGRKYIQLTEKGRAKADAIVKKHSILEKYFKERREGEEAVKITNILEHYIPTEAAYTIRKLSALKKKGVPLTEFKNRECLIADINLDGRLFERLISMGLYPGEKLRIVKRLPNTIIVEVKGKKLALDKNIAERIEVVEYEDS